MIGQHQCFANGFADSHVFFEQLPIGQQSIEDSVRPEQNRPGQHQHRELELFCGGHCSNRGQVGGWAFSLQTPAGRVLQEAADSHPRASLQRMHLMAIDRGLRHCSGGAIVTLVVTDQLVEDIMARHLRDWLRHGWRSIRHRANARLWTRIGGQLRRVNLRVQFVKAEHGNRRVQSVCDRAKMASSHTEQIAVANET
ncbi:RNase H family protein [Novipirellula aureliae]|uniref:RNase H family protein n=1 Tax=Novipirellula aureliae TaxID=2527966 RepID=UPI001E57E71E|nr:RNase H family protein [Novipirellula aureliae]